VQLERAFPALEFERPVDFQHAGDFLFVVEQDGVIRIFDNDPAPSQSTVFLDIRNKVSRSGNEKGLLGLAFAPNYKTSGYFYVYYSSGTSPHNSIVARYTRKTSNERQADPTSEQIVLSVTQPYSNHNGGQIAFGPDGYLYIGLGDGGSGGDPLGHGQDRKTLLGSILRIDVSTLPYTIPSDNPFKGNTSGFKEEIWAWGLRNPWRFSFDTQTGKLYAADVGQNAQEEIDIIAKGKNYGWNIMEGPDCYSPPTGCNKTGLEQPVYSYAPNGGSRSITGGYVYHSTSVPSLQGKYIYADYIEGYIWALSPDSTSTQLLNTSYNISSFGQGPHGEVYILAFNDKLYRFSPATLTAGKAIPNQDYTSRQPIAPLVLSGATGGVVPYTYSLTPDLPPGLTLNTNTRTISGTPTQPMAATSYTWKATDQLDASVSLTFSITVGVSSDRTQEIPSPAVVVQGNLPNPFSSTTAIVLDLDEAARVSVSVLDLLGRTVLEVPPQALPAGVGQRVPLDTAKLPAGAYLYRIVADTGGKRHIETGTMLRVR